MNKELENEINKFCGICRQNGLYSDFNDLLDNLLVDVKNAVEIEQNRAWAKKEIICGSTITDIIDNYRKEIDSKLV